MTLQKQQPGMAGNDVEKFVVRLPSGMRSQIADVARTNRRSMNSEIIARLEDSMANAYVLSEASAETLTTVQEPSTPAGNSTPQAKEFLEEHLLAHFRRLSPEKQRALLELLGD